MLNLSAVMKSLGKQRTVAVEDAEHPAEGN